MNVTYLMLNDVILKVYFTASACVFDLEIFRKAAKTLDFDVSWVFCHIAGPGLSI